MTTTSYGNLITPAGRLIFAHLDKPDTFRKATKFKASLVYDEGDPAWETFMQKIKAISETAFGGKLPFEPSMRKDDNDQLVRDEGKMICGSASSRKPVVVDGSKMPLDPEKVGWGSICRFSVQPYPYDGFGGGVSLRLQGVQVIQLRNDDPGFDEIQPEEAIVDSGF